MPIQPEGPGDPNDRSFIEEARRRQIVEAAIETIAELGYSGGTFARIAERARISPSLISYHFRSKSELNRAIALDIQADLRGSVSGAARDATSHLDAVRHVIIGFVGYVERNRSRMQALRQLELALGSGSRAGIGVLDEQAGVALWMDLLSAGQRAGELRSFDPRSVAVGIMGLLGAVPRELVRNPDADAGRLGEELAALVTAGLAVSGASHPQRRTTG